MLLKLGKFGLNNAIIRITKQVTQASLESLVVFPVLLTSSEGSAKKGSSQHFCISSAWKTLKQAKVMSDNTGNPTFAVDITLLAHPLHMPKMVDIVYKNVYPWNIDINPPKRYKLWCSCRNGIVPRLASRTETRS